MCPADAEQLIRALCQLRKRQMLKDLAAQCDIGMCIREQNVFHATDNIRFKGCIKVNGCHIDAAHPEQLGNHLTATADFDHALATQLRHKAYLLHIAVETLALFVRCGLVVSCIDLNGHATRKC